MPYAFVITETPETPSLPQGYELVQIEDKEDAPKGARIVETLEEADVLVAEADKKAEAAVDSGGVRADVSTLTQEQFVEKHHKKVAVALAKELGVPSTGNEKTVVARIYESIGGT